MKQAEALIVPILSLDWLIDSNNASKKEDEAQYLMNEVDTSVPDIKDEDEAEDGAEDEHDGKANGKANATKTQDKGKKRGRNSKVKEESPEADEEAPPPAKKQKDGQKAKSKALNIPVDEGCALQGKSRSLEVTNLL